MNNKNQGALATLSALQFVALTAASFLTGLAGLALCFTQRFYGITSILLFTAAGLAGFWLILRSVKNVIAALDKAGLTIVMGSAPQTQVRNENTATTVSTDAGASTERKWQTQVAADTFAGTTPPQPKQEPRLGIPRTRQAPAKIGGEWED